MTDYELVVNVKKECQQSLLALYDQYKPYISKSFRLIKLPYAYKKSIKDDYFQDAYLEVYESCKSVDFSKLSCSIDDWKFLYWYKYSILKINGRVYENYGYRVKGDFDLISENVRSNDWVYECDKNIYNEQLLKFASKKISERDLEVLKMREEGKNLTDISRFFNLSYGTIHKIIFDNQNFLRENGFNIELITSRSK